MVNNIINYKGYIGSVNFDSLDRIFYGRVLGISDVIGFEGQSVEELEADFKDAIDDYVETCKQIKREPEKPFSNKIMLEIPPKLHQEISIKASQHQKNVEEWIIEVCRVIAVS